MQSLLRSMTPGAAGRARVDDGGAAARRPAARRPRPARLEPGPAAAGRPRRAGPVRRRRAARARRGARPDRPARRRWTGSRTRCPTSSARATWPRIDRDEVRDLLGDEAVRDLDALDDLARRLEEAGYLTRDGERLELTPARQPPDRPEGPRRPVRAAAARRVRRSPHRSRRPGRGARGDDQAVRVRRPVPPRPARHAVQRPGARGERPGARAAPAAIGRST